MTEPDDASTLPKRTIQKRVLVERSGDGLSVRVDVDVCLTHDYVLSTAPGWKTCRHPSPTRMVFCLLCRDWMLRQSSRSTSATAKKAKSGACCINNSNALALPVITLQLFQTPLGG